MSVTIKKLRFDDDECHRCGNQADFTLLGRHDTCAYCGNEIDLCRACAREIASEMIDAAKLPTSLSQSHRGGNMTDQELVKLAAKAARKDVYFVEGIPRDCTGMTSDCNALAAPIWNPLIDDGDALRLAVNLKIEIRHGRRGKCIYAQPKDANFMCEEAIYHNADECSATRRAIVRAAAEQAKS